MSEKLKNHNRDGHSFLEKLFNISLENPQFTFEDIFAETVSILAGATDTSSVGSSFVATMLAIYPEYQETVFQEILTAMPEKDTDLTLADLDKLEFTDAVIKECLRLFPNVPMISRINFKPITLANGIIIPANVPIVIGLRQIHLREEYYGSSANKFYPYRFLDKSMDNIPAASYIPFSFGIRNCIGLYYAQISVKMFIVHLVRNFNLKTPYKKIEDLKLLHNGSLRLVDKHMLKLDRRKT